MDLIKEFFLEAFPNPERVGCPDEETLMALAAGLLPPGHPALTHVSSCSECFAEYRGCCVELQEKKKPQDTPVVEKLEQRHWSFYASSLGSSIQPTTRAVNRVWAWFAEYLRRHSH